MTKKWLSVLIPTRNRLHLLKVTLESVFIQDLDGVEVLIGDNYSTDGTREYLKTIERKEVRVILRSGDGGFQENVNELVSSSVGENFIILHDDDYVFLGAFATVKKIIENRGRDYSMLIGGYEFRNFDLSILIDSVQFSDGVLSPSEAFIYFSRGWLMRAPSIYYNRKFASVPFYDVKYDIAADSVAIFDHICRGPVIVVACSLGVYRQSASGMTINGSKSLSWGEASLALARHVQLESRSAGFDRKAVADFIRTIYGPWLRSSIISSIRKGRFLDVGDYVYAYFMVLVGGRAVSWNLKAKVKSTVLRICSKNFGRLGRRVALRGFSNFKSPSLISDTVQLIGLSKISIGELTTVGQGSTLIVNDIMNSSLRIGNRGYIGKNVYISVGDFVVIGDYALIGAGCQLLGGGHAISYGECYRGSRVVSYGRIDLGINVWLGNSATLIGDVRIGYGCVIAAGAYVRNMDLPPMVMVAGSPAKIVKAYNHILQAWEVVNGGIVKSDASRGLPTAVEYLKIIELKGKWICPDDTSFDYRGGFTF